MSAMDLLRSLNEKSQRTAKITAELAEVFERAGCTHKTTQDAYSELIDLLYKTESQAELARDFIRSLPIIDAQSIVREAVVRTAERLGYKIETTPEGWLRFVLPPALVRCKNNKRGYREYLRNTLYYMMQTYQKEHEDYGHRTAQTVVFKHIYTSGSQSKDYDNMESKLVMDAICVHFLCDDSMKHINRYECAIEGNIDLLVVYVVPKGEFICWQERYDNTPEGQV